MLLTVERLRAAVDGDAALRRVQRLQPVGGPGDKIFPPTYPGEGKDPARHAFEDRRIDGATVRCVLLDSVQSQANRLEQALRDSPVAIPQIVVDFTGTDAADIGQISSLDAPHRVFDAIIRDSMFGDEKFAGCSIDLALLQAKPTNALPIFQVDPNSLIFGVWNSTREGGGLGTKFARCLVSEIIGVHAVEGQKGAIRVDPLGIRSGVKVVGGPLDWTRATGKAGEKGLKPPSKVNHSNVISNLVAGGATIDHARHSAVLSCAALRRLKFPPIADDTAGRTVLAALALVALTQQDQAGYALRSRCDLVADGVASFEIVHPDGTAHSIEIDAAAAVSLFQETLAVAKDAGFPWEMEPIRLVPQPRLIELVMESRKRALKGVAEDADATTEE